MSTTFRLKKPVRPRTIRVERSAPREALPLEVRHETLPAEGERRLLGQACLERYAVLRRKAAAMRLWLVLAAERDAKC